LSAFGVRRSALGVRRSAFGARRSALGSAFGSAFGARFAGLGSRFGDMSTENLFESDPALRSRIARELAPVTPLPAPSRRVVWLLPVALPLLVGSVLLFGLRFDAPAIGLPLTWGASVVEMCLGLALSLAALREAVPGMALSRRLIGSAFGVAATLVLAVTWLTWSISPTRIAPGHVLWVWQVCVGGTFVAALPPLMLSTWLVARAYAVRPAVAGALYGLGAGLMSDAGWRLFCHFSDPGHVLGAHILGVALACGAGIATAVIFRSRKS
jgi:hypothetical protein